MFSSKRDVAALSVGSNTTLTVLKLIVGLLTGSVSVLAEAIHSGVDLIAAIIAFFAVRTSARPPDDKYQYGRGKVENVSGTIEAVLIFFAAAVIIYEAVTKILRGGGEPPRVDIGLVAMGISVIVNIAVSKQLFRVAKRTQSPALEADGYHLSTDVWTSLGVFGGLVVVRITGLAILDPIIAIGVACLIIKAAWDITRRSSADLLDRSLPDPERERVAEILFQHNNLFADYHEVRTRKAAGHRYVDLHLVVRAEASVSEAHKICDHLEEDLQEALGPCSLTIHVEPCGEDCTECTVVCDKNRRTRLPAGF
jgi:cation diffusion facilitator family transporter